MATLRWLAGDRAETARLYSLAISAECLLPGGGCGGEYFLERGAVR